jgi:hypothetical protein
MTARRLFDALNQQFFGGRLPAYTVRERQRIPGMGEEQVGKCDDLRRTIWLISGLAPDMRRQTLLHEMCHVGCPGFHGKRFQKRLLKLAALGEEWAREEAELCALQGNMTLKQYIRPTIEDLARGLPHIPWRTARRRLRAEHGEVFDSVAPWARGVWLKEASAYRSRLSTKS